MRKYIMKQLSGLFRNKQDLQRERAERQGCSGRCYWDEGMCPCVETCDETRVGEYIATVIGALSIILLVLGVPLLIIIGFVVNHLP